MGPAGPEVISWEAWGHNECPPPGLPGGGGCGGARSASEAPRIMRRGFWGCCLTPRANSRPLLPEGGRSSCSGRLRLRVLPRSCQGWRVSFTFMLGWCRARTLNELSLFPCMGEEWPSRPPSAPSRLSLSCGRHGHISLPSTRLRMLALCCPLVLRNGCEGAGWK